MSQPILRLLNRFEFLPLERPTVIYHYTGDKVEEKTAFYRIIRTTISDQNPIVYLVNKRANPPRWEVRLESDNQTVHSVQISNDKFPTIRFCKKQIHSSIFGLRLSSLGIIVSMIFAGFKFFRGINRISWLLPTSTLALSSIGFIYAATVQRKALFKFVNVLATVVDLKERNIPITNDSLLCDESKYMKNPWLPWTI